MSANVGHKQISGSVYDAVVLNTASKYLEGRIPAVGAIMEFDDGRKFRYCSTASVFVASEMVAMATCQATEIGNLCTAADIGATQITINTTSVAMFGGSAGVLAAGRLNGGYVSTTDDAAEGYIYRIKHQYAATAAISMVLDLYDSLKVALTVASDVCLIGPKYGLVVQGTASLPCIGAAMVPTTGATSSVLAYFWAQVAGPATCLATAGVSVGDVVAPGAAGIVQTTAEAGSGVYEQVVGVALASPSTDGSAPILLRIE